MGRLGSIEGLQTLNNTQQDSFKPFEKISVWQKGESGRSYLSDDNRFKEYTLKTFCFVYVAVVFICLFCLSLAVCVVCVCVCVCVCV